MIQNILLYPEKVKYHLSEDFGNEYRGKIEIDFIDYVEEYVEDILENSDIASRVEILRLFDENGMNDLVRENYSQS